MMPASYQFAGLDSEMIELTQELEELGGGDAKSVGMELHHLIRRDEDIHESQQTLWRHDNSIGLRDIHSKDQSIAKSMRYYTTLSASFAYPYEHFSSTETVNNVVEDTTKWLLEGFNNCVLSIGPSLIGKTDTMFGNFGFLSSDANDANSSLSAQLLRSLYHHKERQKDNMEYRIGLSAWAFDGQRNIDLMVRVAETNMPLEFAVIECPTIDIALQVLNEARKRAIGALSANPDYSRNRRQEEDKSHFFARIMLFQRDLRAIDRGTASIHTGTASSLFLVDLLGFTDIDSNYYKTLPNKDKIIVRNRNLQLQSLLQLVQEMASICRNALEYPSRPMEHMKRYAKLMESKALTSARSSKLSKLLAPIIQGNTRTVVLGYVEDGVTTFEHTRDLITQLQYVPEVRSAVYRMEDIPFNDLNFKSHLTVLGPKYDLKASHLQSQRHEANNNLLYTSHSKEPVYQPDARIAEQFETLAFGGRNVNNIHITANFKDRSVSSNVPSYKSPEKRQNVSILATDQETSSLSAAAAAAAAAKKRISVQEINLTNLLEDEFDLTNFDRTPQTISSNSHRTIDLSSKDDSGSQHLVDDIQRLVPETAPGTKTTDIYHQRSTNDSVNLSAKSNKNTAAIQSLMDEFHSLMSIVETNSRMEHSATTNASVLQRNPAANSERIFMKQAPIEQFGQEAPRSWPDAYQHQAPQHQHHSWPQRQNSASPLRSATVLPFSSSTNQPASSKSANNQKYSELIAESQRLLDQHQYNGDVGYPPSLVTSLDQPLPSSSSVTQPPLVPTTTTSPSRLNKSQYSALSQSDRVPQYNQEPRLWSSSHDALFAQIPMGIGAQTAVTSAVPTSATPVVLSNSKSNFNNEQIQEEDSLDYHGRQLLLSGSKQHNKEVGTSQEENRYSRAVTAADTIIRRSSRSNSPAAMNPRGASSSNSNINTKPQSPQPRRRESRQHISSSPSKKQQSQRSTRDSSPSSSPSPQLSDTEENDNNDSDSEDEDDNNNKPRGDESSDGASSGEQPRDMPSSISSAGNDSYNNNLHQVASRERKHVSRSTNQGNNNNIKNSKKGDEETNAYVSKHRIDSNIPKSQLSQSLHVRHSIETKGDYSNNQTQNFRHTTKSTDSALRQALSSAEEETENLVRVKESLILALQNEKAHRMQLEKENQQLRDGYVEIRAQHEVEVDALQYSVHHLKNQVKKLCEQGACLDIFETFEKDVQRLSRENTLLREMNVKLECQVADMETQMEDVQVEVISLADIGQTTNIEEKDVLERRRRLQQQWNRNASKQKTLIERLKVSGRERENLKLEYEKLKAKERQFIVAERMKEDTSRRLKKAFYDLQMIKKESDQQSLRLMEMERENNILKHDLQQFQKSDELIRAERDRLLSEVAELRTKIRFFEAEENRVAKLNKFVSKHTSYSTGGSYSAGGHNENQVQNHAPAINMSGGHVATHRISFDRAPLRQYSQPSKPPPPPLPQAAPQPMAQPPQHPYSSSSSSYASHQYEEERKSSTPSSSFGRDKRDKKSSHVDHKSSWNKEAVFIEDSIAQHAPSLLPMFQQLASNVRFK